ncbi:MAG: 4-hydroxyphenylpyruvate dioxygenase [Chloroflexi bacterium]|nr:4-hydroxyphenylpyruvate dioxygenase [Chloroflexota bacterium]
MSQTNVRPSKTEAADTVAVPADTVAAPKETVAPPTAPRVEARTQRGASLDVDVREDFLPIQAVEYVEFWVGNAYQAAQFYRTLFGFDVVAYAGPETGIRDRASYVLRQGQVTLILAAGLGPESPVTQHVARHGDGVRDVALRIPDVDAAHDAVTRRGAVPVEAPSSLEGSKGVVRRAAIALYGDTIHSLVDRSRYTGVWMPRYRRVEDLRGEPAGIAEIDHIVGNVELGQMNRWTAFYRDVMGFSQLVHFTDEQVSTKYTALMSKVMQNGSGRVKFPINEPAPGKRKSQIDEFLEFYRGPGVQHIALLTDDIVKTVRALRARGVRFLRVPETYYAALRDRIGKIEESFDDIQELGILADRDDEGYLLQIFTKPVQDRPTLFYEIIERRGARGFGLGNFKALFEALERDQAARGNL